MASHFHQISDNIHEMINTTEFEAFVINSPFFNRLHEVNQSSTVYMTFPTVRTKRYEHSLGVMQLTSEIFRNAAVNVAGTEIMECLIENLKKEFGKIENYIRREEELQLSLGNEIEEYLDDVKDEIDFPEFIGKYFYSCFESRSLLNLIPGCIRDGYEAFLFVAIVQALRFAGLLHDIGHPPQSHIIESVITNIGENIKKINVKERTSRQTDFLRIYNKYQGHDDKIINRLDNQLAIKKENPNFEETALHERIGLYIMKSIFEWAVPKYLLSKFSNTETEDQKTLWSLYALTVVEFLFGIVRNKDNFFDGLHCIIDSSIDTDRLDFVRRDTFNAGVSWGNISYKRLISTARFGLIASMKPDSKELRLCYSFKNAKLMEALLRDRYRIFSEINYHHKCTKIAGAYKRAVEALANSYLQSTEPNSKIIDHQYTDISGLWRMLDSTFSAQNAILNIAQWNDSWLTSILYNCLTANYSSRNIKNNEIQTCVLYLKEIFFNEGTHMSLIKRKTELDQINNAINEIIQDYLNELYDSLYKTESMLRDMVNKLSESDKNAYYSYKKTYLEYCAVNELYFALYEKNWYELENILGPDIITDVIKEFLNSEKAKGEIKHYFFEKTTFSSGTKTENIFIYTEQGICDSFKEYTTIKEEIETHRLNLPLYYIYIKPTENRKIDFSRLRDELGHSIGLALLNASQNFVEQVD